MSLADSRRVHTFYDLIMYSPFSHGYMQAKFQEALAAGLQGQSRLEAAFGLVSRVADAACMPEYTLRLCCCISCRSHT